MRFEVHIVEVSSGIKVESFGIELKTIKYENGKSNILENSFIQMK